MITYIYKVSFAKDKRSKPYSIDYFLNPEETHWTFWKAKEDNECITVEYIITDTESKEYNIALLNNLMSEEEIEDKARENRLNIIENNINI